jgi:hypothetical protein
MAKQGGGAAAAHDLDGLLWGLRVYTAPLCVCARKGVLIVVVLVGNALPYLLTHNQLWGSRGQLGGLSAKQCQRDEQ